MLLFFILIFKKSIIATTLIFAGLGIVLTLFHQEMFKLWTSQNISNRALAISFSLALIIYGFVNVFSALLNALNQVSSQLRYTALGAFLNILLGVALGKIWHETGVMIGLFLALLPLLIANSLDIRRIWFHPESFFRDEKGSIN